MAEGMDPWSSQGRGAVEIDVQIKKSEPQGFRPTIYFIKTTMLVPSLRWDDIGAVIDKFNKSSLLLRIRSFRRWHEGRSLSRHLQIQLREYEPLTPIPIHEVEKGDRSHCRVCRNMGDESHESASQH